MKLIAAPSASQSQLRSSQVNISSNKNKRISDIDHSNHCHYSLQASNCFMASNSNNRHVNYNHYQTSRVYVANSSNVSNNWQSNLSNAQSPSITTSYARTNDEVLFGTPFQSATLMSNFNHSQHSGRVC